MTKSKKGLGKAANEVDSCCRVSLNDEEAGVSEGENAGEDAERESEAVLSSKIISNHNLNEVKKQKEENKGLQEADCDNCKNITDNNDDNMTVSMRSSFSISGSTNGDDMRASSATTTRRSSIDTNQKIKRFVVKVLISSKTLFIISCFVSLLFTVVISTLIFLLPETHIRKMWILYGFALMVLSGYLLTASHVVGRAQSRNHHRHYNTTTTTTSNDTTTSEEEETQGLLANTMEIIITRLDLPSETIQTK